MTEAELAAIEDRNLCSNPFRDEIQDDVRLLIAEVHRLRTKFHAEARGARRAKGFMRRVLAAVELERAAQERRKLADEASVMCGRDPQRAADDDSQDADARQTEPHN